MKTFNIAAKCMPKFHYMVNIEDKLCQIRKMVDAGDYFVINRGRQYGKTTTLSELAKYLRNDYAVVSLDFQEMSNAEFQNEFTFASAFANIFTEKNSWYGAETLFNDNKEFQHLHKISENGTAFSLRILFQSIYKICESSDKPIVLIIDEVDSATNNQVFLDFLAQLRKGYINRDNIETFQSVILAGVYDIRTLKLKLRPESDHKYNSPWNIAAKFNVDMSFSPEEISSMLQEYEAAKHTGMDIKQIAQIIYNYTSGYPYLVSYICKLMDEELPEQSFFQNHPVWTEHGIGEAVKIILTESNNPLFGSMTKQLNLYPELHEMLENILYQGRSIPYSPQNETINLGIMFGFLKADHGLVAVSNRIFEMILLNLFVSEESSHSESYYAGMRDKNQFIENGMLNMDLVMKKFVLHYSDVFGDSDEKFLEEKGRKIFLMYLKPIINGVGNYYLEAATRDLTRTDVIVDYLGQQFIIEMKIWRGNEYNERGEQQICGYLERYHQKKGYMLSFNFNKNKQPGVQEIHIKDKCIVEAVV